jgi:hypothetical protein
VDFIQPDPLPVSKIVVYKPIPVVELVPVSVRLPYAVILSDESYTVIPCSPVPVMSTVPLVEVMK